MKRIPRVVSALGVCALLALSYSPLVKTKAAEKKPVVAARAALDTQNARSLALQYSGDASAVSALRSGAVPTALTSADFDFDGAPDLVAGYRTATGGVVTLTRGNPDAFAPKDTRWYQKAAHGNVSPTFVSKSTAFAVPESPDFLAAADFTGKGHVDLLVAKRGGGAYLLDGDGNGKLAAARRLELPGDVTALAVGGTRVAIAITSGNNSEVLVFEPRSNNGFANPVATHALATTATSMEWGSLGGNTADLAVAAGKNVVVFYDARHDGGQSETINLAYQVHAVSIGEYIWDRENRMEIAALGNDGGLHILQHGTLDTRPVTKAEIPGRRAHMMEMRKQLVDPTSLGAWSEGKVLPGVASGNSNLHTLVDASPVLPNGLMVLDGIQRQISLLQPTNKAAGAQALAYAGTPVAARALPALLNGQRSMVMLTSSQVAPVVLPSLPDPTWNVSTTTDEDLDDACINSAVTTNSGALSLREAVCLANNNAPAASTINVPAGTYKLTNFESGELQPGSPSAAVSITIVGLGSGPANTIIEQTDGKDRVIEQDFPFAFSNPLSISNLTLTGGNCTDTSINDCGFGGGAMVGLGNVGDNLTLTNVVLSGNESNPNPAQESEGGALNAGGSGSLTITNSTFSGNTVAQGAGGALAFNVNAGPGNNLTLTNSTFTSNTSNPVTSGGSAPAEGGAVALLPSSGNTVSITGSTFTGNTAASGGVGGALYAIDSGVTVSTSRISGNTAGNGSGFYEDNGTGSDSATVTNNWWGCNAGPGNAGCDSVTKAGSGESDSFNPWLVLSIGASPTSIVTGGTSTLTADLTHNSNNTGGFSVPNTTPVSFGGSLGTDNPTSTTLTSGQATSVFTATGPGSGSGTATVDNQTVSVGISITGAALSVSQSAVGTFTQGQTGQWQITVSNTTASTNTSGTVTVTDNLPGGYTLNTFTGTDWSCGSVGPAVTCTSSDVIVGGSSDPVLTLTVNISANSPPSVTNSATASGGNATTSPLSTNTVSVVQVPTSVTVNGSATQSTNVNTAFGSLAVTVKDAGNVPISGYSVVFTAPGAGPSGTFSNSSNTITVSTNGGGLADPGVFTANGNGGSYTVSAAAGTASANFNLTNLQAPSFTSASSTTFLVGSAGSFNVTATGFPAPTFSETGALPSGVTLSPSGLLSGTPAAGTAGFYNIAITASNGVSPSATQPFTLAVVTAGVDLVEPSVSMTTVSPVAGGTISITDTTGNQGAVAAGASLTFLYVSPDGVTKLKYLGDRSIGALASGATSTGTTVVTLPTNLLGTYYIIGCADGPGAIHESNKANNCGVSGPFTVAGADLTVSSISVPASGGASIAVTDTTQDIGLGAAGVSRTYFYLSSDGVTQGMYLGDRGIVPLAAGGGSSTGTTTLTLPAYLVGTYYIIGCANGANQVPESNTSNNCMASNSFNLLGADLVISNVSVPGHASGTIAVQNTTMNQPGGSVAGSSATYIYFSTDGVTQGKLLGGHNVPSLAPGASSTVTTTVALPSGLSSGSYFVIVCADATNTVPESNETNNCTASSAFSVP